MRTKQQIIDRIRNLDKELVEAVNRARSQTKVSQRPERVRLFNECEAAGGHVFVSVNSIFPQRVAPSVCCVCGYDKQAEATAAAANLSKAA